MKSSPDEVLLILKDWFERDVPLTATICTLNPVIVKNRFTCLIPCFISHLHPEKKLLKLAISGIDTGLCELSLIEFPIVFGTGDLADDTDPVAHALTFYVDPNCALVLAELSDSFYDRAKRLSQGPEDD